MCDNECWSNWEKWEMFFKWGVNGGKNVGRGRKKGGEECVGVEGMDMM